MDNKIKTSLVAAAVSAVLSNTAIAATPAQQAQKSSSLAEFDYNTQMVIAKQNAQTRSAKLGKQVASKNALQAVKNAQQGDHFDKHLGVNTFSWGKPSQKFSTVPFSVMDRKLGATQAAKEFLHQTGGKHGFVSHVKNEAKMKAVHDLGRGAIVVRYQQEVNGLEVLNRQINVMMNQKMELVATTGYFSKDTGPRAPVDSQFKLSENQAVKFAFGDMGAKNVQLTDNGEKAGYKNFTASSDNFGLTDKPRAKRVYYPGLKELIPAYKVEIFAKEKGEPELSAYQYVIEAATGKILQRHNLTNHQSYTYRVFADTAEDASTPLKPYDSPFGNAVSPHPTGVYDQDLNGQQVETNLVTIKNAGISTDDPWLPEGATTTSGNVVDAFADFAFGDLTFTEPQYDDNGNLINAGDRRVEISSENTFDYQYDVNADVFSDNNINAAIVNLFYTINYLHDVYYDHGFTEEWGTAQINNYGRGGEENDQMQAQAMDAESFNNANMSTPSDGASPQMQMYLWGANAQISMSMGNLGEIDAQTTTGWGASEYDVTGSGVRLQGETTTTGCNGDTITNAAELAGKIAFIDRGACSFVEKANNAQSAGAIAAVIVNNDADNPDDRPPLGTGDDHHGITIPVVGISYRNGQAVYEELKEGRDSVSIAGKLRLRDGTLDNVIVAHEWAHYTTSRLTNRGMYFNSQGASMGEGWSDFFALLMVAEESDTSFFNNANWAGLYNVGSFALSDGAGADPYYFGIRRTPYTTDMNYNALTFKHIERDVPLPDTHPINGGDATKAGAINDFVHRSGEVWANALWEAFIQMVNLDGMTYPQAQSKMMDYIIAGLKISPARPTFTEMRDSVLAAALADSEVNYNAMRVGFAKRGMGPAAISPDRFDLGSFDAGGGHRGVVEDFAVERTMVQMLDFKLDNEYMGENGGYCDNDGILDRRETAAFKITVGNAGNKDGSSLKAKISTESEMDIEFSNDGVIEFTQLAGWLSVAEAMVEVKLNGGAETNQELVLNVEFITEDEEAVVPADFQVSVNVHRDLMKSAERTMDDFESGDVAWGDWSQSKTGEGHGGHFQQLEQWTVMPDFVDGFTTTMMGPDRGVEGDLVLNTPMLSVGESGDFVMAFDHFYWMETSADNSGAVVNWDGGVMEVSIDGGDWVDVVEAGGVFVDGYNGVIGDFNPILGGRNGFVSNHPNWWITPESLTFPEGTLNGKDVQIRFRIGSDSNTSEWGWNIDNVQFTNVTNPTWSVVAEDADMCNPPPTITASQTSVSLDERESVTLSVSASDVDGEAITYAWSIDGVNVGNDSETYDYTAPRVTSDQTVVVSVTATDIHGNASEPANISVNINNSKSGGSMGLMALLLAPLAFIRRRKIK